MTAEFGATPWGRAWLRTAEPVAAPPDRLRPKARSLARNNAVTSLTITAGQVEAEVAGHRTTLRLPVWDDTERVERLVAKALDNAGPLAPGDLPDDLAAAFRSEGIAIAVPPDALAPDCACPARRPLCVHALATLYALIQRIDETPALALDLRRQAPSTDPSDPPSADWTPLSTIDLTTFYDSPAESNRPTT